MAATGIYMHPACRSFTSKVHSVLIGFDSSTPVKLSNTVSKEDQDAEFEGQVRSREISKKNGAEQVRKLYRLTVERKSMDSQSPLEFLLKVD